MMQITRIIGTNDILKCMNDFQEFSGVSPSELIESIGLTRMTLNKWQHGAVPTIDKAFRILDACGFDLIAVPRIGDDLNE